MANDCFTRLKEFFKEDEKFSDEAIKRLVSDIESLKQLSIDHPDQGSFNSRVMEYVKEKRELSEVQAAMRATNLKLTKERFRYYTQPQFSKDPVEAFRGILEFTKFLANSGRDSIHGRISALQHDYNNFYYGQLEKLGITKLILSGELDRDIHIAVDAFARGENPVGIRDEAIKAGKIINDLNNKIFKDMRDAGAPVRYMPGYVASQTHNIPKITDTEFSKWFNDVFPLLDKKRTFGINSGNMESMSRQMQAIYKAIKAGSVGVDTVLGGKEIEDTLLNTGATRNAAQKLSQSRFLHFKGPVEAHNYNSMYGNGTISENLVADFHRKARMIGAMQKFGTNPEAALAADIDRVEGQLRREGNVAGADKLKKEKQSLMNNYKEVMGATSIPGQNALAKISQAVRSVNGLSKLGNAGIRAISNMAFTAMELKTQTGMNFLEASWKTAQEWLGSIPKENQQEFARRAGFFLNDFQNEILNMGGSFNPGANPGALTRMQKIMFKLNGLDFNTRAPKYAFGNMFMHNLGENAGKSFDKLNPRMQATLLTAGIEAKDYQFFKHATETTADGRVMVTPEKVGQLDESLVKERAEELGVTPRKYIRELQNKFSSHIILSADVASTSAGPRARNIINGGTFTGTPEGEIRRLGGQFKTFAIGAHFTGLRFLNSAPDEIALMKGLATSPGANNYISGKDFGSFAQFLVASTALGFLGQALIDTANGKGVKDPRKVDTWVDSMTKGGAGALYTDFLAGEYDRFNFTENVMGPTFGQLFGPGAHLLTTSRKALITGNEKRQATAGVEATKMIRQNIPFQQLPIAKQALDWLQYDVIQSSLRPNYKARSERLRRKDAEDRLPNLFGGE